MSLRIELILFYLASVWYGLAIPSVIIYAPYFFFIIIVWGVGLAVWMLSIGDRYDPFDLGR